MNILETKEEFWKKDKINRDLFGGKGIIRNLQRQNIGFDYPVSFRVGARLDRHYSIFKQRVTCVTLLSFVSQGQVPLTPSLLKPLFTTVSILEIVVFLSSSPVSYFFFRCLLVDNFHRTALIDNNQVVNSLSLNIIRLHNRNILNGEYFFFD